MIEAGADELVASHSVGVTRERADRRTLFRGRTDGRAVRGYLPRGTRAPACRGRFGAG
jgi:hypothetical protein